MHSGGHAIRRVNPSSLSPLWVNPQTGGISTGRPYPLDRRLEDDDAAGLTRAFTLVLRRRAYPLRRSSPG